MTPNNRPNISVFIATSIDGYIAKKNWDIDWVTKFSLPTDKNEDKDCGFGKFFAGIDVLVRGKIVMRWYLILILGLMKGRVL